MTPFFVSLGAIAQHGPGGPGDPDLIITPENVYDYFTLTFFVDEDVVGYDGEITVTNFIPEPGTVMMLVSGLAGLALARWRRAAALGGMAEAGYFGCRGRRQPSTASSRS